jgi:methylenetetrahydrofolate reductase (NADPH)
MSSAPSIEVSFEFFPPADPAAETQWWRSVQRLAPLRPEFVSVTCGANGSTRSRTQHCVRRLLRETELRVAPHVTCVGASRETIQALAKEYWAMGVRDVVALRGDAPPARDCYRPMMGDFPYGSDLVRGLRSFAPFTVAVAAYPEGHPETPGVHVDLQSLQRKVAAGATRALTQFFFDTDAFLRYRDQCVALGLSIPIVPGILPIVNFDQVVRFAGRCGSSIPRALHSRFEGLDHDAADHRRRIAEDIVVEQVLRLREHGVTAFHFYTLNRADLTDAACRALGLTAARSHDSRSDTSPPRMAVE